MSDSECLQNFSPVVRDWFLENIGEPSEPQRKSWPEIAAGNNVLVCAPTGSGKTFAAFLKCLDILYGNKKPDARNTGVSIIYVSPLKALNNDIYRNLELPLKGISEKAKTLGIDLPEINIAVRTGDTPQKERNRMLRQPPDILITTPESLFIMLTAGRYRKLFSTVEYIIVDEIHSICTNKRGVHLSVSMERIEWLTGHPVKRIGLSATVNPLEEAAGFLAGCTLNRGMNANERTPGKARQISIVNCDIRRKLELTVNLPVKDLKVLPDNTVWPAIYAQLLALISTAKSTLIFVNNRRAAEMVASGLNKLAGLREKGACFIKDLSKFTGIAAGELLNKLERLVWSGIITNDAFSVARYFIDLEKKNSSWVKYNTYPNMGRWNLAGDVSLPHNEKGLKMHINRLLDRYGVISKNIADCEKDIFKWSDIYSYLKNSEFSSGIKRGFYISGLSGIQFARDRELELIRMQDSTDKGEKFVTLCSCDPANPYRDILCRASNIKVPKNQGTAIVFANGQPVLVLRDYGSSILPLTEDRDVAIKAARSFVEAFVSRSLWMAKKSIFAEFWGKKTADAVCKIEDSPVYGELLDMGFDRGYSGITLWRRV